ncbi:MAG: hypothetical protein AAF288_13575 [Planctomycetota bacterium]
MNTSWNQSVPGRRGRGWGLRVWLCLAAMGLALGAPGVAQPPPPPGDDASRAENTPDGVDPFSTPGSAEGRPQGAPSAAASPGSPVSALPVQAPTQNQALAISANRKAAVVPVKGMINGFTAESIETRVAQAMADGADLIVLEIDTNGGRVDSALAISKYLKGLPGGVQTVAWINNKAISAGIMIAAACDRIVMAPAAQTGDCAPIIPGVDLAPTERAKAFSPIAAEFKDSAARNGYDYPLFHAMCVVGVELYYVERIDDPTQRRLVNQTDYQIMVKGSLPPGGYLPIQFNTSAPSGLPGVLPGAAPGTGAAGTGPNPFDVVSRSDFVDPALDLGQWRPVTQAGSLALPEGRVHDGLTLLTIDDRRAEAIGLSVGTVQGSAALQQKFQASGMTVYPPKWTARAAYFLTHPLSRAVLVLVLIAGAFIELQSPGLGVGGAISLVAAVLLFGAPYLVGLAEIWHILLFAVGLGMLIIELLFTPTFGVLGVVGIAAMVVGLVMTVIPAFTQSSGAGGAYSNPEAWDRLLVSSVTILSSCVVAAIGLGVMGARFQKIPAFRAMMLTDEPPRQDLDDAAGTPSTFEEPAWAQGPGVAVGDVGRASSSLHPSGSALFEGHDEPVDVVTVGGAIDAGAKVRVVEVAGYRVVVETA